MGLADVVQLPVPNEMERHLLDLLAKVRAGEIEYLATTCLCRDGVIEERVIEDGG